MSAFAVFSLMPDAGVSDGSWVKLVGGKTLRVLHEAGSYRSVML